MKESQEQPGDIDLSPTEESDPQESVYDGPDRRERVERRSESEVDRRNGWDRRRGPGRRRSDSRRSAEEGEMDDEQFSFVMAIDEYKRVNKRPFPSYTEILEIAKALGYRKVAEAEPLVPGKNK